MIRVDVSTGTWRNPSPAGRRLRLIAAGDICPAQGWKLDELFAAGRASAERVYGDLLPELAKKDLSVADLELPLSAGGERIIKDGPHLRGPAGAIEGFLAGGFDVADLANNHVLDFGPEALRDTLTLARSRGLEVLGAGENAATAAQPLILLRNGLRVGLLAVAENEFSNATRTTPGAAPLQPGPNAAAIAALRSQCDVLVVFVHGGNEYCPFPSPRMVRDYRSFVEAGADAVIGHHAHTVQGMELYRGVPIVYNLGNFLFWSEPKEEGWLWWQEMFVRLTFAGRSCEAIDVHPVRLDPGTAQASLLTGPAKEAFLARLNRLSEVIADADLHERFWNAYCLARLPFYLARLQETRAGMDRPELRQLAAAHLRNLFTCEAHQEVIATGLELIRQGREKHCFGVEEELERLTRG